MTGRESHAAIEQGTEAPSSSVTRSLVAILLLNVVVRAIAIALLPEGAVAIDYKAFRLVSSILGTGENPYATTTILNWPPFLMQLFYLIGRLGDLAGLDFIDLLRVFLIAAESILMVLILRLLLLVSPGANWKALLVIGIVLNPIEILLVCQHGNLDLLVMIWVVSSMIWVLHHERSRRPVEWLLGCLFLGLGVLTKSYPMLLAPILVAGFRRASNAERALGAILFIGPAVYGLSILFVIDPPAMIRNVLLYESIPGYFGVTGLGPLLGWSSSSWIWGPIISLVLVFLLGLAVSMVWRGGLPADSRLVLYTALTMLAVPTLGPGFGTQYIHWSLPFLIVTYAALGRRWRLTLLFALLVTIVTYCFIYALSSGHGAALVQASSEPAIARLSAWVSGQRGQSLSTAPMFGTWLVVLATGLIEIRSRRVASA